MSEELEPVDAGPEVLPEAQPEPVVEPVAEPASDPFGDLVAKWVSDCIHNSPVAQSTDAYNHFVTKALPELKRRLAAI